MSNTMTFVYAESPSDNVIHSLLTDSIYCKNLNDDEKNYRSYYGVLSGSSNNSHSNYTKSNLARPCYGNGFHHSVAFLG
jgi:hypothetical protein